MKKIISILIATSFAGVAFADIAIELKNNGGVVTTDGTTNVGKAFVQLIWTASTPEAQAGIGATLGSGEFLLNSLITTDGFAGTWSDQPIGVLTYVDADVGGADINDGYFFVRMFDNTATGLGDFYLQQYQQGIPLAESNPDVGAPPPPYNSNTFLGGDLSLGNQVIPEPAVAALLGIFGGGLLITRRIFKKEA